MRSWVDDRHFSVAVIIMKFHHPAGIGTLITAVNMKHDDHCTNIKIIKNLILININCQLQYNAINTTKIWK